MSDKSCQNRSYLVYRAVFDGRKQWEHEQKKRGEEKRGGEEIAQAQDKPTIRQPQEKNKAATRQGKPRNQKIKMKNISWFALSCGCLIFFLEVVLWLAYHIS